MREADLEQPASSERRTPDETVVGDAAERVDVARRRRLLARDELGRDVVGRPDEGAVVRQARPVPRRREAEVGELGAALLVDEDVGGLHVAVYESTRVQRVQRGGDVRYQRGGARGLERAGVEEPRERGRIEREREKGLSRLLARGEHRDEVAALHLRGDAGLAEEAVAPLRIPRLLRAEQLQRDVALAVVGAEDDRRRTLAELLVELVAPDRGAKLHPAIIRRVKEIRLLGPVEALRDGARVPLGPKPLALVALLALGRGRVVSMDRILDELWAERPPDTALKVIQVYVSQLRKALGAETIETREPGYRVELAEEELDLARFEALTAAAQNLDPRARAARLREALALWHGEALAGLREPFAAAAGARLEELRLAALEERIAAELELGLGSELVPELEELVREEPLRERPRGQLMLALYRGGRQADALTRYREGRRVLVEELGLEPGPALQELERAILRQDPGLVPVGARPPRTVVVLDEELVGLARPLAGVEHELLLARIVGDPAELAAATEALRPLAAEARVAVFTSRSPAEDTIRLAREQDATLVLGRYAGLDALRALDALPCDLALSAADMSRCQAPGHVPPGDGAPVTVPFGGGEHEWAVPSLALAGARPRRAAAPRRQRRSARPSRREPPPRERLARRPALRGHRPEPALADPDSSPTPRRPSSSSASPTTGARTASARCARHSSRLRPRRSSSSAAASAPAASPRTRA